MSPDDDSLEDLDREALKRRVSEKWNTYPKDVLPAWVAEMDYPLAPPIRAVLQHAIDCDDLGYPLDLRETGLAEVFADRMASRFGWSVDPAQVNIITDVVQGIFVALEVYAEPGDGAIVQTPIYPPFLSSVQETGRRLVENRLVSGDARWEIDFDALNRDVDERTRLLLLCSPHNPTGRCFERSELETLAEFACEHDLVVVSDEIHGDLLFDGRVHIPIGSLGPEIAARTLTLTSATKAFNIPGLRTAIAHFGSAELQSRFDSIPRHVRGGVGLLGIQATIAAWRDSQPWLDAVRAKLEANRNFLTEFLAARLPEVVCHPSEATYLAWLDTSALEIPRSPAAAVLKQQKIALSDGRFFGNGFEKFVRINFATSRAILSEVLEGFEKAIRNAASS